MSTIIYNGNEYTTRSQLSEFEGVMLATAVSGAILAPLKYMGKPFINQLQKEEIYNDKYRDSFIKALSNPEIGLSESGLKIINAQNLMENNDYKLGKNACFIPKTKEVLINTDKICCAGFHELGHALNELKSKYGVKFLAKLRKPGYAIAALMEYFAIFSRTKPKEQPRNLTDVIEDNCGKIAFIAMLPIVLEEAIASIRGIKVAKKSGLESSLVNNLKKLYSKALLTYGARTVLGGLAVFASRKVMDYYTRPRPVEKQTWY